jgi:predicted acyltransferase
MRPQWYGILGLIGWCYLICSLLYLLVRDRMVLLSAFFLFFLAFNIADRSGLLELLDPVKRHVWIVSSGALPALVMAGIICSVISRKCTEAGKPVRALWIMGALAVCSLAAGFALRPEWGISKIRATPSWVLICTAISMISFSILIWVMDIRGRQSWINWLKPAGTSTLTCYLLPYIHYGILNWIGIRSTLPWAFRTGGIGIVKSLLYACVIVWVTGLLERKKIRLAI